MSAETVRVLDRETRSSIELTRNARGDYQWCLKLYVEDGREAEAQPVLERLDQQLRSSFLGEACE